MLVDLDFWPDYLSKGRKYLTGLGEVSMTELFLGKVCFPLEQGHRCLTQCKIFSQPVLPARCQPAYSLHQEMCFLNQLSLCQTITSARTGCLLYTPLFPQGPVLPLAYGDQPQALLYSDSSEILKRMHLAVPGSPSPLRPALPYHPPSKVSQATSTLAVSLV